MEYYIDNTLVRASGVDVPDDPMQAHANFWVPSADFAEAYDPGLAPVSTPGANTNYQLEVDRVEISRINTSIGTNLLGNESFETALLDAGSGSSGTGTGEWYAFNQASIDSVPEVDPRTGFQSLKMFGPFFAAAASGAWQNVDITGFAPGQEFEASVFAQNPFFDPLTTQTGAVFTEMTLQFIDSAGNVIGTGPGDFFGDNQKTTPVFDSRDTNLPALQDQWIEYKVNAKAPAGADFVRMQLIIIQEGPFDGTVQCGTTMPRWWPFPKTLRQRSIPTSTTMATPTMPIS